MDKSKIQRYAGAILLASAIGICLNGCSKQPKKTYYVEPVEVEDKMYSLPEGYILTYDLNGNLVGAKVIEPIINVNEHGEIIYSAPIGYVLTHDNEGNRICVKYIPLDKFKEEISSLER